jgi:RimJ/RimL family protein N-acetyltransferase
VVASFSDPGVVTETKRVVIRPWHPEEADRFYDMHRRPEVARGIGGNPMADRGDALTRIERYRTQLAADPRFGAWAVIERSSGRPAGTVLLKALPDGAGEIEIGWHLHPDCWGRGLASEAAAAVLARGFASGLEEVWGSLCSVWFSSATCTSGPAGVTRIR